MSDSIAQPNHTTHEMKSTYQYWRLHIMVGMYLGYAGFYFTRKTFNYATPALILSLIHI